MSDLANLHDAHLDVVVATERDSFRSGLRWGMGLGTLLGISATMTVLSLLEVLL